MEAETLKKNKKSISKGKIKKSMKNILCRPDPVFWPALSEDHCSQLENVIRQYKVEIPEFKKPHWSEIKEIPKEHRPKAPTLNKVEGLLFGISKCARSIESNDCEGIIIDADVNPRILVHHIVEGCVSSKIPVVCLKELKKISTENFGFPTCCLGLKKDVGTVSKLKDKVNELSHRYKVPQKVETNQEPAMDVDDGTSVAQLETKATPFTYLYRTSKKTRVFNPSAVSNPLTKRTGFVGQDFIEFSHLSEKKQSSKSYMNMIVKKFTNNPNRIKKK
ncbi:hypothetical protein JYU34_001584 [Plutella xylostella]|uniref:Ribosomal protein L7Ae/L30e/S12e/Gadd45 domain-containing protein n=1 Tax=Plutella xylostella TaxID=51655 RepID=A0ABQ7R499_PLUXY|nr:hypothetical protein JYU34_001584 [Plutella xylostella]